MRKVLVTGGAGYVGSHACKAFARAGWDVSVLDNLSRGFRESVKWGKFFQTDIRDKEAVTAILKQVQPQVVAHFAAYAYVGESVGSPELYYDNNTHGTQCLVDAMRAARVDRLIFSSTCATYGVPRRIPIDENHEQSPVNPYGWSKLFVEQMLRDYAAAHGLASISLRYFNAAGCDPDLEIGEDHEPETHVIPLAIRGASADDFTFVVNGTDFDTRDGTAVRDYVHVADLADAHVLAAEYLIGQSGFQAFNLGTGGGTTVAEIIGAVERVAGRRLRSVSGPPRPGDPPLLIADSSAARSVLKWRPRRSSIDEIVRTAWAWEHRSHG